MKKINLMELSEKLVEYGKKKGAHQIQVSASEGSEFSVDVREQKIERLTEAGSNGIRFKVIVDNKVAHASSSDFNEDTLHKMIDNAIIRAKLSGLDEFSGLPDKEEINISIEKLKLFDEKVIELSPKFKIDTAKKLEKIALADKRIKLSEGASFSTYSSTFYLANSNGFSKSYKGTSCGCGVYLQAGEGDHFFEDGWSESSRNVANLPDVESIAKTAINRVTRLIGARKVDTQKVPVITEPTMSARLLGFLASCISGRSIYMKQSYLVDKLNSKIGVDFLNVIDDPFLPGAPGSKPFDGEGVPTRKSTIVENGILKSYLLDTYSGKKLKMKSTGHASGTNNFYIAPGKFSPDEIIKSVDKGLLLTKTMGQGTNATTGDISTGAFGLWIEKGQIVFPVAEITISGNLGQMLNEIEMIGNDLDYRRATSAPTMKFKEMTVSGV